MAEKLRETIIEQLARWIERREICEMLANDILDIPEIAAWLCSQNA